MILDIISYMRAYIFILLMAMCSTNVAASDVTNATGVENDSQKIEFRKDSVLESRYYVRYIVGIIISLAVAFSILLILRRYYYGQQKTSTTKNILLVEVKKISPKLAIIIINVNDRQYVIGQSSDKMTLIDKYDVPENVDS